MWTVFRRFELLRLKGRWLSGRSLEHYIQECQTFLNESTLSEESRRRVEVMQRAVEGMWRKWLVKQWVWSGETPPEAEQTQRSARARRRGWARHGSATPAV